MKTVSITLELVSSYDDMIICRMPDGALMEFKESNITPETYDERIVSAIRILSAIVAGPKPAPKPSAQLGRPSAQQAQQGQPSKASKASKASPAQPSPAQPDPVQDPYQYACLVNEEAASTLDGMSITSIDTDAINEIWVNASHSERMSIAKSLSRYPVGERIKIARYLPSKLKELIVALAKRSDGLDTDFTPAEEAEFLGIDTSVEALGLSQRSSRAEIDEEFSSSSIAMILSAGKERSGKSFVPLPKK